MALGPILPDAAVSGQGRLFVQPDDPTLAPANGVETNVSGFPAGGFAPSSSFQVGAEAVIGSDDAVFGIFESDRLGPIGFFDVFDNTTDRSLHLAYSSGLLVTGSGAYDFRLVAGAGTVWSLTVNGLPFSSNASNDSFDFGTPSIGWTGGLTFSEVVFASGTTTVPDLVRVYEAIGVLHGGHWTFPGAAHEEFQGAGVSPWGEAGRDQSDQIAPGEVVTGTSVAVLRNGTPLWSGGPVLVEVRATSSSARLLATVPLEINVSVAETNGTPLSEVPVAVSDPLGGQEAVGPWRTGASGAVSVDFRTANLTRTTSDPIAVRVTVPGFVGNASLSITVDPERRLTVRAAPPTATLVTGEAMSITFRTTDPSGGPVGPTTLEFTSAPGGSVSVPFATSDASGNLTVRFTAGPNPGVEVVTALVAEPGAWGQGNATAHVVRPSPAWYVRWFPEISLGIVAAAAIGIGLLGLRRRRSRRPLPPLVLPTPVEEVDPTERPTPPISRRPP